jgi:serine/threonine protein kinase/tetratricopeptide (TPR) repeat protein
MSPKFFKQKREENIKLKEVCSNCRKPVAATSSSSETDLNNCCCQAAEPGCLATTEQTLAPVTIEQPKAQTVDLGERYEVLEVIGYGGMGTVYRAKDKILGKEFAVKVLKDELAADESAIKRFEQEANAASDLTHLNMLAVYGHGKTPAGSHYIVMDLLEGESLAQLLKREGSLDANRAINISIQVCHALAHAHMKGLVHRDLKPSNIMLVKSGSSADLVKVLDFGIAKLMPGQKRETLNLTQTGEIFGSPSYMSPEQCLGCSQDARSDIYSLGCMMYEMIVGRPPLVGKNPIQTVAKHLNEDPPSLSKVVPSAQIPRGLEETIMRCLEKDTEQRYQSMDHLAADLQLIASGLTPKQKKKKAKKPIDLLSAPLLAIYISVSMLLGYFGQELVQKCIPIFWLSILSMYFWRWLASKREVESSPQEKWKRALIWSFFCAFTLLTPAVAVSIFNVELPFNSEITFLYNLLMICLVTFAIPITAFGWFLAWALSIAGASKKLRRTILSLLILVPVASTIFARAQVAWIPFKISEMLVTHSDSKLACLLVPPADVLRNISITLNPEFSNAYFARGERNRLERTADAVNDLTKAFDLTKSGNTSRDSLQAEQALRMILQIHVDAKQYDLALKDLTFLSNTGSKNNSSFWNPSDYYTRAKCYEKLKLYKNALADYSKAISRQIYRAYGDRARLNAKLGNYEQALSDYSTSIELQPELRATRAGRAALFMKLGKKALAMNDYKEIVSRPIGIVPLNEPLRHKVLSDSIPIGIIPSNEPLKHEVLTNMYYAAIAFDALGDKTKADTLFEMLKKNGFTRPADDEELDTAESFY